MVPNIVLAFSKLKQLTFLLLLWYISQSFQYGLPEIVRASTELTVTVNFSETLFVHPLLLSRISSIIIFEVRTRTVLLKNKTLILSDQSSNSTFNVHNPHRMKLFTRLQAGLNQLREHKFRQNFQDFRQLFCNYGWHIETIFTSFFTAQITQIKGKSFSKKLVTSFFVEPKWYNYS